jgi:hypothetical protein
MKFKVTNDFKFNSFGNSLRLLQRIGNMLTRNIIARTEHENVDSKRRKFKKYSTKPYFFQVKKSGKGKYKTFKGGYAEYKNYMGGSGNIVNLKSVLPVGEHMVSSTGIQTISLAKDCVTVGVAGRNLKKAMWNENMGRAFLGVSKDDEKDIDKIIDRYVDEELNKL